VTNGVSHSSIGEVLSMLQGEYPDVTISKIRFLESQGLLNPERTPSGYRKFHDEDIERLRWILTQQRDHFLPLKVIKERLAAGDFADGPPEGVLPFERSALAHSPESDSASNGSNGSSAVTSVRTGERDVDGPSNDRARVVASLQEAPVQPVKPQRGRKRHPTGHSKGDPTPAPPTEPDPDEPSVSLTLEELVELSGVSSSVIHELETYGLLKIRSLGQVEFYDDDALMVARLAGGFNRFGIEPRHLRMYKVSADREAGLFDQLITPLLRTRRADARDQAVEMLEELAELADDLRAVMVRASLREYLGES